MDCKRKVMFFPASMKGHLVHTSRISEWYLEHPDEYEVHVCASSDCEEFLPEGIIFHTNEAAVPCSFFENVFTAVSEGKTSVDCLRILLSSFPIDRMVNALKVSLDILKEVKPDVVVYEHAFNLSNVMYTACTCLKIPNVMLVAMARPESALNPLTLLGCLVRYPVSTSRTLKKLGSIAKEFEPILGCKLIPESNKPFTMYPGAQCLCEVPPLPNEIYTGPFYPLPIERALSPTASTRNMSPMSSMASGSPTPTASGRRLRRRRSSRFSIDLDSFEDGLGGWIMAKRLEGLPIVYIALGTLATPSSELLARIVEALDDGPWAVIWALPEAHQERLPGRLSEQWFVHKFLPQAALFTARVPGCFVSHCGGSSTTEAISNGIPMVCLPFFGDQYEWADSVSSHIKAGVKIDKCRSSAADIRKAVQAVLDDKAFGRRAAAVAEEMAHNARLRLDFLGVKLQGTQRRVGVPVAAAVIEKCMLGQDPREVLPLELRPAPTKSSTCCACFEGFQKAENNGQKL